jgi:hypothetical protein
VTLQGIALAIEDDQVGETVVPPQAPNGWRVPQWAKWVVGGAATIAVVGIVVWKLILRPKQKKGSPSE